MFFPVYFFKSIFCVWSPEGHKVPNCPREVTYNCFPLDLKSCCFVIFVLSCYCSLVHTDSRARRNVGVRLANNDQKNPNNHKSQRARCDLVTAPTYTMPILASMLHPAPPFQPNPCPPARSGMLRDSSPFPQESHLGFSGRLGGGRGTGSVPAKLAVVPT